MSHISTIPSQQRNDHALWIPISGDDYPNATENENYDDQAARDTHSAVTSRAREEHEQLPATTQAASYRRSSSSSSRQTPVDRQTKATVSERPAKFDFEESKLLTSALWLPYTLRRPFLSSLAAVSLLLSVFLAVISAYSSRNHGLRDDDDSVGLFFARKYLPTLVAVFLTLAISMVAEDVKSTETFARMASPKPFAAEHTLFYVPKVWWKSFYDGLSSKRNGGHRRWVLSLSSLAAGISVLVISTFSSSIFTTQQVVLQAETQLDLYTAQQDGSINLFPRRYTYSRAISGFLYNASTSLWVSDSHVVLPFAPPNEDRNKISLSNGVWEAETKVMQLESKCSSMSLTHKTALDVTFSSTLDFCNGTCATQSKGFKLRSEDGCEIQIQSPVALRNATPNGGVLIKDSIDGYYTDTLSLRGGMMWTNLSSSYVSWQDLIQEQGESPRIESDGEELLNQWSRTFIYSISDECLGRELLLVSPPWYAARIIGKPKSWQESYWENFTIRAEICTPTYYEADLPVTVAIGGAFPKTSFDKSEFLRLRKLVPERSLDLGRLNQLAFDGAWSKYMTTPEGISDDPVFEGLSMLLARPFSLNLTDMMQNETLTVEASRLRARFFSELIWSSVAEADVPSLKEIAGKLTKMETRVVVVFGIGITVAVLLSLAACYLFAMLWYASNRKRPLDLHSDPTTTAGAASLIKFSTELAADFRGWNAHSRTDIQQIIGSQYYTLRTGTLGKQERVEKIDEDTGISEKNDRSWVKRNFPKRSSKYDWRPLMLCKRWLIALVASLIAITTTLLVLRKYADKGMLFQAAFIEQVKINQLHVDFSPHALIATLVAVTVGICWDGIDKSLRTLQPYLAMSRKELKASQGISVSYNSSYWAWAALKSARSRHWILCLVAIGTTLTQILTVSMAAIFERQTVVHTRFLQKMDPISVFRTHTIRQEPFQFSIGIGQRPFYLTNMLLETDKTDWLYNALDEIALDFSTPAWTKDEWIFTPVNMRFGSESGGSGSSKEGLQSEAEYIESSVNISITTSAVRSRLECKPVRSPTTGWLDSVQDAFPDSFNKSMSGQVLPTTFSDGASFKAPIFSAPRRMACCTNGTSPGGQSVISYWSSNNVINDKRPEVLDEDAPENFQELNMWSREFAIKWIVGSTGSVSVSGTDPTHVNDLVGYANETALYFVEEPQVAFLDCTPVIEQVDASVTIARYTEQILEFELLGTPQPVHEAWDYAYDVVYPEKFVPKICQSDATTIECSPSSGTECTGNVSYGVFFMSQLLTAPHIIEPRKYSSELVKNRTLEDLDSERFSIRDTDAGLNMDFLSYANYVLAGKNPNALLDHDMLIKHSEKTLQTFFKHFATTGKWTYGAEVKPALYEEASYYLNDIQADAEVAERIEVLAMNKVATWLSLTIIFLLMIILVILIVSLQIIYPRTSMLRNVECLADVLGMVAGSDQLLGLVHEVGVEGVEKSDVRTKLGWFRDRRGVIRWGVEVANGGGVEWLDEPDEVKR